MGKVIKKYLDKDNSWYFINIYIISINIMQNIDKYRSYINNLESELNSYNEKPKAGFEYLALFPKILNICVNIYTSKNLNITDSLRSKIKGTLEYAEADIDFLPEAIMGKRGLFDDLYIAILMILVDNGLENMH